MKRILAVILGMMLVLACTSALAETGIDTGAVLTQVVIWVLCGVLTVLGAVFTWVAKAYIIPWVRDVAVPWLTQHQLLEAAKEAVEYAEAMLGRLNGEAKLKLALEVLKDKGWDIDSDAVVQAVKAKWLELNLAQVGAGVKDTAAG